MPFRNTPRFSSGRSASRRIGVHAGSRSSAPVSRETLTVDGMHVTVLRKKNRNMYLRVKPPYGAIEITAPTRMPESAIVDFVRERRSWIDDALRKMAAARARTFTSPNVDPNIPTSAVIAPRDSGQGSQEESAHNNDFAWNEQSIAQARESIEMQLPALLRKWEPIIGKSPSKITLRLMSSRWGSCTPKTGRIRLNLQLGLMDPKFLEYVLVHEMVHLWEHGHGTGFQARMSETLPNWKELRRELNRCTLLAVPEVKQ